MAETPVVNNMQADMAATPAAAEMTPTMATVTAPATNTSLEALQRQMVSAAQTAEEVFRREFLANHFNDASQNALQFQHATDQTGNLVFNVIPSNPAMTADAVAASISQSLGAMQDTTGAFTIKPPVQGQSGFQVAFPQGMTADALYEKIIAAEISKQQALQMTATAPAEQNTSAAQAVPAMQIAPAAQVETATQVATAQAMPDAGLKPIGMETAAAPVPAMQQPASPPVAENIPAGKQWAKEVTAERAQAAANAGIPKIG